MGDNTSIVPVVPSPRWGGSFVAWDCLSVKMNAPYEDNYPLASILTGNVTCPDSGGNIVLGSIVAALLVAFHTIFLLSPLFVTHLLLIARPRLESHVRSFETLVLSMFAFVLASAGEIAQHIFDNWLYIDSRVSTYNFVFYLMTTASNAIYASGLGSSTIQVALSVLACLASPIAFIIEYLNGNPYMSVGSQIPIWIGMFITTLLVIYRGWELQMPGGSKEKWIYTVVILVTYVLGVLCGILIISTGYQQWHLLTAGSFCAGFLVEGFWVSRAYSAPKGTKRQ